MGVGHAPPKYEHAQRDRPPPPFHPHELCERLLANLSFKLWLKFWLKFNR